MSLKICGRLFTGPSDPAVAVVRSNHPAAVFAVIDKAGQAWDPEFRLIDIGDTGGATVVFASHPDLGRWMAEAKGKLAIYLHVPDAEAGDAAVQRQALLKTIRADWPPGGLISVAR